MSSRRTYVVLGSVAVLLCAAACSPEAEPQEAPSAEQEAAEALSSSPAGDPGIRVEGLQASAESFAEVPLIEGASSDVQDTLATSEVSAEFEEVVAFYDRELDGFERRDFTDGSAYAPADGDGPSVYVLRTERADQQRVTVLAPGESTRSANSNSGRSTESETGSNDNGLDGATAQFEGDDQPENQDPGLGRGWEPVEIDREAIRNERAREHQPDLGRPLYPEFDVNTGRRLTLEQRRARTPPANAPRGVPVVSTNPEALE